jgi:adenine-specific DNA-methyltransferase
MAKKQTPLAVETLTHDEARRRNIPTAECQSAMRKEEEQPVRIAYGCGAAGQEEEKDGRNRDLDPQLVWRGKDEQDWSDLVVPVVPDRWDDEVVTHNFTSVHIIVQCSNVVFSQQR